MVVAVQMILYKTAYKIYYSHYLGVLFNVYFIYSTCEYVKYKKK